MNQQEHRETARKFGKMAGLAFKNGARGTANKYLQRKDFHSHAAIALQVAEAYTAGRKAEEAARKAKDAARKRDARAKVAV